MALASLVPLIFVAQVATGAGTAEARCAGIGNPVVGTLVIGGSVWASETPDPNTCNNDLNYYASFRSHMATWRATLILSDANGRKVNNIGTYGNTSSGTNITYPSGFTRITLCVDDVGFWGIGTVYCGWGGNYQAFYNQTAMVYDTTYYGSNTGY